MTKCGWASIDENGHAAGGAAGDQTGRELKTGSWYDFGQTVVLRPKSRDLGIKMARVMRKICNNSHVGYDQGNRTSLWVEMARVGWDPDKIKRNVETDCSALTAVVCRACGVSISPDIWTGNLRGALIKTKKFEALTSAYYTEHSAGLRKGDIILNPARHVIMAIEDGPVVKGQEGLNELIGAELALDGYRGPATKKCGIMAVQAGLNKKYEYKLEVNGSYNTATKAAVDKHPVTPGQKGDLVKAVQCLLYIRGYDPDGIDGHYGAAMKRAVGEYQAEHVPPVDYSVGPKTMLRLVG